MLTAGVKIEFLWIRGLIYILFTTVGNLTTLLLATVDWWRQQMVLNHFYHKSRKPSSYHVFSTQSSFNKNMKSSRSVLWRPLWNIALLSHFDSASTKALWRVFLIDYSCWIERFRIILYMTSFWSRTLCITSQTLYYYGETYQHQIKY